MTEKATEQSQPTTPVRAKKSGKLKKLFKKKWVWALLIIGGLIVIGIIYQKSKPVIPEFSSAVVQRKDLKQTVSETGSVVSSIEVGYGWEISGRVVSTTKEVGDTVHFGDLVAMLDSTQQESQLSEAVASRASALANLNLQLAGPSSEAIAKSQAAVEAARATVEQQKANRLKSQAASEQKVDSAEDALRTAKNNLQLIEGGEDSDIVNDAYEDLVNTLKTTVSSLASALIQSDAVLGIDNNYADNDIERDLSNLDSSQLVKAKSDYDVAKRSLKNAENGVMALTVMSTHTEVDVVVPGMQSAVDDMQTLLYQVQQSLRATRPLGSATQTKLDTFIASITSAQTSVNAAATSLLNSVQAVTSARNSLTSYQIAYNTAVMNLENAKQQAVADNAVADAQVVSAQASLKQAEASHADLVNPPRAVDVASLRAEVTRQGSNVDRMVEEVQKTKLRALSEGVISRLDVKVGENVSMNQNVLGIVSEQLTVEVDISESDIAKVAIDDPVSITLDAFGDDTEFQGTVASVDPAQTEISGVIYYKTKILIHFTDDQDVRPGMTANIEIMTDKRDNALVIPRRAVIEKDEKKIVRVLTNKERGQFEEKEVTTGLRGDNGEIEITSGLSEGDEIITFLKENGNGTS